jgi:alkylhydroperoxidase/carboxymuconolactone decarboxylase family protein YurZ
VSDAQDGPVAPGLVPHTSEVLCQDRWRRPALASRDRSLVTVSTLIASGHIAHIPSHLHRARAHGLTPAHASEGLTHWAVHVPGRAWGRHAAPRAAGARSASTKRLGQVFRHGTAERRAARRSAVRVMAIRDAVDAECSGAFGSGACRGGVPGVVRRVGSPWVPRRSTLP